MREEDCWDGMMGDLGLLCSSARLQWTRMEEKGEET